jgi:fatty-acyl-CoA synthase
VTTIPTCNTSLPHVAGAFETIAEALDYAARGETGLCIYRAGGEVEIEVSYRQLRARALAMAARLGSLGLPRGARVAVLAETSIDYLAVFYGCQYAGLVPCPVPHALYLGGKAAYVARISSLVASAGAALLCLPDALRGLAPEITAPTPVRTLTFRGLEALPAEGAITPLGPGDPAYLQFSSGSTSQPKGIVATQATVAANIRGILRECIRIRPQDRAFSWLPLYHDMGMVGFALAPLFAQTSIDYISPGLFARSPGLWLELMARNRTSVTFSPSFGYDLAARRAGQSCRWLDLSALRVAGIGGDMIRPGVLQRFAEAFAPAGFNPAAYTPSYGMAESTLLVSYEHGLALDTVDLALLEARSLARPVGPGEPVVPSRSFVICGRALAEHQLSVIDAAGVALPDRHIGEIVVRGPSLAAQAVTAQGLIALTDRSGLLATGDLGYLADGRLVVTGRSKELICLNGRNLWPQDIEEAIVGSAANGVKRAAVFAVDDGEMVRIVALVEAPAMTPEARETALAEIAAAVLAAAGVSVQVVFVAPRSLPYTSSGKLARALAREIYLAAQTPLLPA